MSSNLISQLFTQDYKYQHTLFDLNYFLWEKILLLWWVFFKWIPHSKKNLYSFTDLKWTSLSWKKIIRSWKFEDFHLNFVPGFLSGIRMGIIYLNCRPDFVLFLSRKSLLTKMRIESVQVNNLSTYSICRENSLWKW